MSKKKTRAKKPSLIEAVVNLAFALEDETGNESVTSGVSLLPASGLTVVEVKGEFDPGELGGAVAEGHPSCHSGSMPAAIKACIDGVTCYLDDWHWSLTKHRRKGVRYMKFFFRGQGVHY